MSDYLKKLCLGLAVLALSCTFVAAQPSLGPDSVRERDPVLSADGSLLYFTRPDYTWNQGTENRADIWVRHRDERGHWRKAINPGSPINSFGPDRMLTVSVDGNRLAVLRGGAVRAVDVLERSGRNWRVSESWSLPADVTDLENLAFNVNSLLLVYRYTPAGGTAGDLYHRYAEFGGGWSSPAPVRGVNAAEDETAPQFAGDGRTLLFRRSGKWFRQLDRGATAERTNLPARYLQVAAGGAAVVGTTDDTGRDEHTELITLDDEPLIPFADRHFASLGNPPAPGEHTVSVPLNSDVRLRVYPDLLDRYAVMLRSGEVDFPESTVPSLDRRQSPGSLASLQTPPTVDRRGYLRQTLATKRRELARLDTLRRQYGFTDPLLGQSLVVRGDTTPPATPGERSDTVWSRYAQELSELEEMKAAFRRQQADRMRRRDEASAVPFTVQATGEDAPSEHLPDTTALRASVRAGLYAPLPERLTQHQPWENAIREDLPNSVPLSAEEMARLDAEYARQLREIQALRRQLREVEDAGKTTADYGLAGNQFTPRSVAPVNADPAVASSGALPTFVPNTAYLDGAGYRATDQLAEIIRKATTVVEIRVHTAPSLPTRAAQLLSEERAEALTQQLVALGVAPDSFRVIGYGNHEPTGGERVEVVR